MKNYFRIIFVFFLGIFSYSYAQNENVNGMILSMSTAVSPQNSYRLSYGLSDVFLTAKKAEITLNNLSISGIRDINRKDKYYVSMNSILWPIAKAVNELCDSNSIINAPFFLGLAIFQLMPNSKIEPYIYKDIIRISLGLNTDYYLFNNPAKVYSEFTFGLSFSYKRIILSGCGVVPLINKNLMKTNEGFFSIGLSYKFDETPFTDYLVHLTK